jgi:ankyrin repeat protein
VLEKRDERGWTVLMHAAEANDVQRVESLLGAGAESGATTTGTWGMFEAGSDALRIARLVQGRLGLDRTAVIELLAVRHRGRGQ